MVGNNVIFANNSQLAGHVHVGDWVILGGFTVVHQFVRLGAHSMSAMCSVAVRRPAPVCDVPRPAGRRAVHELRRSASPWLDPGAHFRREGDSSKLCTGTTSRWRPERIAELALERPETAPDVAMMNDFLAGVTANRGIVR